MATNDYVSQAEKALDTVLTAAKAVASRHSDEASFAIIVATTEEVKKIVDPTSAVGRILLASILDRVASKVGNGHNGFHKICEAARTLNPHKK